LHTRNEQLKAAQHYADAIVETVREPLLVLSEDLRVQRANTAFYQFFQVTPQETERRQLEEQGTGQWNIPRLQSLLEQVLLTHHAFNNFEVEHVFPRIGQKTMLLNARCIVNEAEPANSHLILLAIEDMTERKEVERQKETLLGMVSHELKTPLTGALLHTGMIQLFLEQADVVQITPHVQKLEEQLDLLTHHIDDLLDATGAAAKTLRFHLTAFAIDELIRETVEEMQQRNPSRRLLVEGETGTEVSADRERTKQALMNLLSNAIKYASETEPIRVCALVSEELVTVRVQDRGMGIPTDRQAQIFDRFYRINDSSKQGTPGLGLGLYLTAQIIKQQGGQIWVESIEGMGSTFSFTLPRNGASGLTHVI
jgi:two-component system CheB/CheR fusion protein